MGAAQGERRGHLTKTSEPEAQHSGGDAAAMGATPEQAARTAAFRDYRAVLASMDLEEVWERTCGNPDCPNPTGCHFSAWVLTGYRHTHRRVDDTKPTTPLLPADATTAALLIGWRGAALKGESIPR